MAGASLLALLDDLTTLLDDVATLTKVAGTKTAGVLGDDLALNAQQVSGVAAERELPVVWAVAKGSARNKLILVPAALALSAAAPFLVTPLLVIGGTYLCFEGVEKIVHAVVPHADDEAHGAALAEALAQPEVDLVAFEQAQIRGAVRTDFILSAEIVTIALGTVAHVPFVTRVLVLSGIAAVMTVGVYGLVAAIVKLDDLGLHLASRPGSGAGARLARATGRGLVGAAPWLMRALSLAGTAAMFLVGGGILAHGVPPLHHAIEHAVHTVESAAGATVGSLAGHGLEALAGAAAGLVVLAAVSVVRRVRGAPAH